MNIFLPQNFNPAKDIVNYNPKWREKYLWFLHTIIDEGFKRENDFHGYVNLLSEIVQDYLGSAYYKKIIENLRLSGIVEINPAYSTQKGFAKSFRLSDRFSQGVRIESFIGGKANDYIKKLRKWRLQMVNNIPNDPVYLQLWKNIQELSIDVKGATKYVNDNKAIFTSEELGARLWCIQNFETGNLHFVVDPKTGRVYNNLTNMPRDLRKFLYRGTEPLIQIDVSNSQPFLFCPLLQPYWEDYQEKMRPYFDSRENYNSFAMLAGIEPDVLIEENGHYHRLSYLLHFEIPQDELPDDFKLYIDLTQKGTFYEEFMTYLEAEGFTLPSRDKFKTEFFAQVFYSTYSRKRNRVHEYEEWFHFWMHNVSNAISWYKRVNHADLPILMQKIEATIIMETCNDLMKIIPQPYFLTIHDAIVCEKKDSVQVQKVLLSKFKQLHNLVPTTKVKSMDL